MPIIGIVASAMRSVSSYESISSVTLGSSSSTITFSSIPQTFKHLQLRMWTLPGSTGDCLLAVNGSGGSTHQFYTTGDGGVNNGYISGNSYIDAGGVSTSYPGSFILDFLDYTNTNKAKVVSCLWGYDFNGSGRVGVDTMLFSSTAAVTSLTFTGRTFAQYSSFALYGIKG